MRRALVILLLVLVGVVVVPLLGSYFLGCGEHPEVVPPPAKQVTIGDGRHLNVVDIGEGSPIVLVHGLPSNIGDWGDTPQKLAAMGHRVIVYDRVGYGHSSRDDDSPGTYTYESNARDLGALLDALGIERAALAGWSYGGAVVQTFAALHPERVSHLALIGSVGPAESYDPDDPLGRILSSGAGEEIFRWTGAISPLSRAFTQENLKAMFAKESAIPEGFNERTRGMLHLPGTLTAFVLEAQRGDPSTLHPEQLRMPALVLHGSSDFAVPLSVGEDLAGKLPAAQLLMIPGGSHMLPITHPDIVAGALHGLVSEH
jgi:pimeloyl-ACP methyl ester carboxylesterase